MGNIRFANYIYLFIQIHLQNSFSQVISLQDQSSNSEESSEIRNAKAPATKPQDPNNLDSNTSSSEEITESVKSDQQLQDTPAHAETQHTQTGQLETQNFQTEQNTAAPETEHREQETEHRVPETEPRPETEYREPETSAPEPHSQDPQTQEIELERDTSTNEPAETEMIPSEETIPETPDTSEEIPATESPIQEPVEHVPEEPVHSPEPEQTEPEETEPEITEAEITEPAAPEPVVPDQPETQPPEPDIQSPEESPENLAKKSSDNVNEISDDEEILKFIEETKQKIFIVGSGGSGSNTLDRLFELGATGASLVAMNTDAKHLLDTKANRKIILGKKISRGRGAGSNPAIGEKAAQESIEEIKNAIGEGSLVFITCGLGGGTGTGSAPVIAEAARSLGALTVAVVTLPFASEGKIRMDNALQGMERLRKHTDTLIVIKNDRLLNLVPDLPLNTAFKVCDEVLAGSVKGIAELVTRSGLVNVDFADLRTILTDAGFAAIGLGEASLDAKQEDRARVAVETALSSPLLDADISSSTRALINVIGGEDMTLKEAEFIVAETSKRINPNAHIIWGARVEENIKKSSMRVLVVLAGVKFPKYEYQPKDTGVDELDLDLIG
jgi:cell division protein FtsZ